MMTQMCEAYMFLLKRFHSAMFKFIQTRGTQLVTYQLILQPFWSLSLQIVIKSLKPNSK